MSEQLSSIKQRFGIVGHSKMLETALETAIRVSATDLSVLITGESGVGKEVFSKIIHHLSPRKHKDFIAVNCGAIPEGTINSELFGHEKGAFTGATNDRKGYFETVNSGTIFLDEIGEMPLDTQAFLLRVLESGEFIKVGSSRVEKTDVRIIAATNVDLLDKVSKGRFREDLYYRLSTVPIKVPSLKERREDISLLFRRFAADFAEKYRRPPVRLEERSVMILENYPWPGNIRELKNVAEQISVMSDERMISAEELVNLMPHLLKRNLPMRGSDNRNGENFQEREILYKLLFDMKNDLNDLKNMFYELVRSNNLRMPEVSHLRSLPAPSGNFPDAAKNSDFFYNDNENNFYEEEEDNRVMIIDSKPNTNFERHPEHSPLAMDEIEKDAIKKALKKYNNRRKEAAEELKISERTLYRKIKEYDL